METPQSGSQDSHIKPQLSISPEEYMRDRVIYKINLYVKLSERQKLWYQWTSVIGIIFAASVPVLINLGIHVIVPTILSLVVTVLVSLERLFHFREHWRNYDAIAAFLRTEQLQFQTLTGVYKDKATKPEDAFRLFFKRIEEGIKEERNDTFEMRMRENE
jgi:uncharacterized membrane protein